MDDPELPPTRERFVAVDRATARRPVARTSSAIAPDVSLLGLVGHLIEQKRPERALDVLDVFATPGRTRTWSSPAPARSRRVRRGARAAVTSRRCVHMLGHRDDVEQVLGALDLLLLTSDAEGIPGVVIEAQMTGCPVVTFPFGAVDDGGRDGQTGVVLARPTPQLMAAR